MLSNISVISVLKYLADFVFEKCLFALNQLMFTDRKDAVQRNGETKTAKKIAQQQNAKGDKTAIVKMTNSRRWIKYGWWKRSKYQTQQGTKPENLENPN